MIRLKNTLVRKTQCASCVFKAEQDGGIQLAPGRREEIHAMVLRGINQLCHHDLTNKTVCRGGRDLQLRVWAALGIIEAPTDEALVNAMRAAGVEPKFKVGDACEQRRTEQGD